MDNEETLPLLDAETQEKIAVAVHAIQKDYTGRLKLFTEDLPSLDPTRLSKGSGTPFAPRQPIAFKKLVTEYANDLFSIESSYYSEGRCLPAGNSINTGYRNKGLDKSSGLCHC
jgi:hypothetical protein